MSTTSGKEVAIIPEREIVQPEPPSPELLAMHAKSIGKFAESSVLELTPAQVKILQKPVPTEEILTRPDGMIYLDWGWYAGVLDEAFGAGHWSLTPAPWNPRLYREGNITYREYVMWVDGHFVANAIGHHEEKRQTPNFGDAAEATYANALTRCCKRLGVARDLWRKKRIEDLKKQMKAGARPASPETIEVEQAKQLEGAESVSPLSTPSSGSAPLLLTADEWKEAIHNAGNLEALRGIWKDLHSRKHLFVPATLQILDDAIDSRKKVLK